MVKEMDCISEHERMKPSVLFLCNRNAGRSQMAEGFMRAAGGQDCDIYSAGIKSSTLSMVAVKVMQECGIDISSQYSKSIADLPRYEFDIITIMDANITDLGPLSAMRVIRLEIPDPGEYIGTEQERKAGFRTVRDAIRKEINEKFRDLI